jgi:hypothetical protein
MGFSHYLRLSAPATQIRPRLRPDGELELYIVTRVVQGAEEVANLSAARIFQLHEELSYHRGLTLLLGDYDFDAPVFHQEFMEGAWGIGHWLRRCRNLFDSFGGGLQPEMRANLLAELSVTSAPAKTAVDKMRNLLGTAEGKDFVKTLLRIAHDPPADASPELLAAYRKLNESFGSSFDVNMEARKVMEVLSARLERADAAVGNLSTRAGLP